MLGMSLPALEMGRMKYKTATRQLPILTGNGQKARQGQPQQVHLVCICPQFIDSGDGESQK